VTDEGPLLGLFLRRAGLGPSGVRTRARLASAVQTIPYGRPGRRTPEGTIADWRGTCSTKHLLLARLLEECFPASRVEVVHRVYKLTRRRALESFGVRVAATVPPDGLSDVHRFLRVDGLVVDATFPTWPRWDGCSDMVPVSGPGEDYVSEGDHDANKRALESRFCDPVAREAFIAALAAHSPAGADEPIGAERRADTASSRAAACLRGPAR
jgi:hypothetical protein